MKFTLIVCVLVAVVVSASAIMSIGVHPVANPELLKDTNVDVHSSILARRHAELTEESKFEVHPSVNLKRRNVAERAKRSAGNPPISKRQASSCGQTFTEEGATITSPNYPESYPNNLDCQWTIEASSGQNVQLIFEDFRIEIPRSHNNVCEFDGLQIRQDNASSEPIDVVCGKIKPSPITVPSDKVFLRMFSDESLGFLGFSLHYHFLGSVENETTGGECDTTFTDPSGVINSTNYPDDYPTNLDCSWTIEAPAGNNIELTFNDFALEGGDSGECNYDGLLVTSDDNSQEFCGDELQPPYISSGNILQLRFNTDQSVSYRGFSISYRFVEANEVSTTVGPSEPNILLSISGGSCTYAVEASPSCDPTSVNFVQRK